MSRWKFWLQCSPKWAAGFACGAVAVVGVGCRSSDPQADPPSRLSAVRAALRPSEGIVAEEPSRVAIMTSPSGSHPPARSPLNSVSSSPNPLIPTSGSTRGGRIQTLAGVDELPKYAPKELPSIQPKVGAQPPTTSDKPLPGETTTTEPIDLGVALRLAGVGNPTISLAREQIRESLALLMGARSLLLPSMNLGGNYHLHSGNLQASFGQIRNVTSQSLYLGFGSRTLAAESVAFPGIRLFAHLGDAYYEPLAARQQVVARRSDAQAVQNDILLRVAVAYVNLVSAEAKREILRQAEVDVNEIARLTRVYAEKGQGLKSDADRAASRASLIAQQLHQAEEGLAIASAHLCQLLNLDPGVRLRTPGGAVLPIPLISEESDLESLVAEGIQNRPELYARTADIQRAKYRVRQERIRPLVPLVSVGFSGGLFGGGGSLVPSNFGPMNGRTDFDVFAVWNIQNMGFGNRARVRGAQAVVGETLAAYDRVVNEVRREISEALADAQAAARRIKLAQTSVALAEEGFRLERERIRLAQGRPIEVLDSFKQLVASREELIRAISEYNASQFRLFVGLGSNPLAGSANGTTIPGVQPVMPKP